MPQPISEDLSRLAALIRAPLAGEDAPPLRIDLRLAALAIERHRVGPLLYAASQTARDDVAPEASVRLARNYRANVLRQTMADLVQQQIAVKFAAAKIPWLAFKGLTLARQLYRDPAWRVASDIDILVSRRSYASATEVLRKSGFETTYDQLPANPLTRHLLSRLAKDVTLKHTSSSSSVELHRRLFFAGEVENHSAALRATFRLGQGTADVPAPPIDVGMVLYLLLHGAASRWFRLKWLADLLPLFAKLDDAETVALADAAENLKAATSVKASLLLFKQVFRLTTLGPLDPWLAEKTDAERISRMAQAHLASLDDATATSPPRKGVRFDALAVRYSMIDSTNYRLAALLRTGAWKALVVVGERLPR